MDIFYPFIHIKILRFFSQKFFNCLLIINDLLFRGQNVSRETFLMYFATQNIYLKLNNKNYKFDKNK